jgi:hypothetical protein
MVFVHCCCLLESHEGPASCGCGSSFVTAALASTERASALEPCCAMRVCVCVCGVCALRCLEWLLCFPREPCPSLRAGFVACPPIKHVDADRLLMLRVCACVVHPESVVVRPAAAASSGPAKVCRSHLSTQVHVTAAGCVSTTFQPRFCGFDGCQGYIHPTSVTFCWSWYACCRC